MRANTFCQQPSAGDLGIFFSSTKSKTFICNGYLISQVLNFPTIMLLEFVENIFLLIFLHRHKFSIIYTFVQAYTWGKNEEKLDRKKIAAHKQNAHFISNSSLHISSEHHSSIIISYMTYTGITNIRPANFSPTRIYTVLCSNYNRTTTQIWYYMSY